MRSLLVYLKKYRKESILAPLFKMLEASFELLVPLVMAAVIDVGIQTSDVNFINMVLVGNISILVSVMVFNVVRDWILMHITARVNIALISDYLIKLMKLPVNFFENKLLGDILQRARDHERIRSFIMNNSLALVFSTFTFLVFSLILLYYNRVIFLISMAKCN